MLDIERGTQRSSRIAGRRLDKHIREDIFTQYPAVGDAIERDTPRKTEAVHTRFRTHSLCERNHRFLKHILQAARHVFMELRQRAFGAAGRFSKQSRKGSTRFPRAHVPAEHLPVERVASIIMDGDERPEFVDIARGTVGCQAHDFVLGAVWFKAQIVCQRAVEKTERIRIDDLPAERQIVSFPDSVGSGRPFADPV